MTHPGTAPRGWAASGWRGPPRTSQRCQRSQPTLTSSVSVFETEGQQGVGGRPSPSPKQPPGWAPSPSPAQGPQEAAGLTRL